MAKRFQPRRPVDRGSSLHVECRGALALWVCLASTGCAVATVGESSAPEGDGGVMDGGGAGPEGAEAMCVARPGLDPDLLPRCCARGRARCLPAGLVPPRSAAMLAACIPGGLCVPDRIVRGGTSYVPRRCRSFGGTVGACVSLCVPMVADQAELLPRDVCESDERCAPCFDPSNNNEPTGACEPASPCADAGVIPRPPPISCPYNGPALLDPAALPACACAGTRCMPASRVPVSQRARLASCPGGFCVPEPYIRAANNYVPRRCTAYGGLVGACVSRCVPMVAAQSAILARDVCAADELCAPCYDPQDGNRPTGACEVPPNCGDGGFPPPPPPLRCPHTGPDVLDPRRLPACQCAGTRCMPAERVPAAQRGMLAVCPGGYCVPDEFIRTANNYLAPSCRPFGGMGEGRCLSRCLPMVASQASQLNQSSCGASQLCVPCFDPRTGADTTACRQTCDPGPREPPFRFPPCCGGRGTCVPTEAVPSAQRGSLSTMGCSTGFLCAPNQNLDPSYRPVRCRAMPNPLPILGQLPAYDGFCVSTCVDRSFFERIGTGQGSCGAGFFCGPCRTPFGGSTGVPGCT